MRKPVMTSIVIGTLLLTGCSGTPSSSPSSQPPSSTAPVETPPTQTPPATAPEKPGSDSQSADPQKPATDPQKPVTDPQKPATEPKPEPPKPAKREMPKEVRGIVVSGWVAGSPDIVWPLLDWAKGAGINTIVLDLKAEDGYLSWESDIPLAQEIGANKRKIGDLAKFIAEVHDRGLWVSGRIVTMNDQWLYKARPEWGIPGFDGGAYSFMDPKNENVWSYNIDVAKAAIKAGVDEIQFDYIRYPEHLRDGYNKNTSPEYRTAHINNFLKRAMAELKPLGVVVGADLFGLTTSVAVGDDMQIGQDYRQIAEIVDYVAAMAYPSHYAPNTYGLANPNAQPYETVKVSLGKAIERSTGIPLEKHRPWIQDFTLGGVHYGPAEVKAQVKALNDLGIRSFMIWDPSCKFSREIDFTK